MIAIGSQYTETFLYYANIIYNAWEKFKLFQSSLFYK